MKLVNTDTKQPDPERPNMVCVGLAIDSSIYYAALVDMRTKKNYVEEVGISPAGTMFTGVFRQIDDDQAWKRVSEFFNKAGVFENFYKGSNWRWAKKDNESIIPDWFTKRYRT